MASYRPSKRIKSSQWDRKSSSSSATCSALKFVLWMGIGSGMILLYTMRPQGNITFSVYDTNVMVTHDNIIAYHSTAPSRALTSHEGDAAAAARQAETTAASMALYNRNDTQMTAQEFASVLASIVRQKNKKPTKNREIYQQQWGIVHLGKCGGVSMKTTLNGYLGYSTRIGQVAMAGTWYHLGKPEIDKYRYWILLVRDPIARLQSWWMYDHTDNFDYRRDSFGFPFKSKLWPKLYECYPTLDEFCTKGLAPFTEVPTDECQLLAQMVVPPKGSAYLSNMQHVRFNFDRYFAPLMAVAEEKQLYVVRLEHMLDDMNDINRLMGDDENVKGVAPVSHWRTTEHLNKDRSISPKGMKNLCRQICHEIQLFKEILDNGINMHEKQTQESLDRLRSSCPVEVEATDCSLDEVWWKENMEPVLTKISRHDVTQVTRDRAAVMFERANPTERMDKAVRIRDNFQPDSEDSFGMLHFGRCGGRTLQVLLESRKQTSKLYEKLKTSWTTPNVAILPQHKHWVIAVRNPIDRVMSWWAYHHPLNLAQRSDYLEQLHKPAAMRAELIFYTTATRPFKNLFCGNPSQKSQRAPEPVLARWCLDTSL